MDTLQRELVTKAGKLRRELFTATGEKIQMPLVLRGTENLLDNIALLETFCATVEGKISAAKPAATPAAPSQAAATAPVIAVETATPVKESATLTDKVRAHKAQSEDTQRVSENHRRASANAQPKTDGVSHTLEGSIDGKPVSLEMKPVKPKTLTEQVIEKRGCKDMAELNRRYVAGEFRDKLD